MTEFEKMEDIVRDIAASVTRIEQALTNLTPALANLAPALTKLSETLASHSDNGCQPDPEEPVSGCSRCGGLATTHVSEKHLSEGVLIATKCYACGYAGGAFIKGYGR